MKAVERLRSLSAKKSNWPKPKGKLDPTAPSYISGEKVRQKLRWAQMGVDKKRGGMTESQFRDWYVKQGGQETDEEFQAALKAFQ